MSTYSCIDFENTDGEYKFKTTKLYFPKLDKKQSHRRTGSN